MTSITLRLIDEADTEALAQALARGLRSGDVVALSGDLGAGKTMLARAVIRALTGDPQEEVPSPTFTLVQCYDSPKGVIWHFDLYRLCAAGEVIELGWDEACRDGIVLVEWPERLECLRPAECLEVALTIDADSEAGFSEPRFAVLTGLGEWGRRLELLLLEAGR